MDGPKTMEWVDIILMPYMEKSTKHCVGFDLYHIQMMGAIVNHIKNLLNMFLVAALVCVNPLTLAKKRHKKTTSAIMDAMDGR